MQTLVYPYSIPYPRTNDWWSGRWWDLSTWCNSAYGIQNWEYMQERFMFKSEKDKLMFALRWL